MVGVIGTLDVLAHPFVTIRCFGWQTFLRALYAGRSQTFLSLLGENRFFEGADSEAATLIERCVQLELHARRIYAALAEALGDNGPLARFFTTLADQEQDHADLLRLCLATARHGDWKLVAFCPWRDDLPDLEMQMHTVESSLSTIDNLDKALRLVIQIESSEINQVFQAVLAAGSSEFVQKLRPFRDAVEEHIGFIVTQIPAFAPNLATISRELQVKSFTTPTNSP